MHTKVYEEVVQRSLREVLSSSLSVTTFEECAEQTQHQRVAQLALPGWAAWF